nr:diguanylate cyclase [Alphaproteobacteria bacterium]
MIAVGPIAVKDVSGADAWIPEPATPAQLAARIRALFRLDVMERIAERRKAVTALYGDRAPTIEPLNSPATVLYVGDASPRFMSLVHVMEDVDAEVVAAFSSYSAFDYLHERSFDAVVLNADGKRDMAFTISSAMRRNARLYHTPILLLTGDEDAEAADEAFARGVSDILTGSTDDLGMRERVLTLAAERRRRRDAKALLEACRDPRTLEIDTGLFHSGFVTSHIQDLLNVMETGEISFAILALQADLPDGIERPDDTSAEKARRQFAAMLRHLLRAEDAAARLNASTFLAVLPFTESDGVDCVAARVSAIAECTAFESEDPLQPFRLSVISRTVIPQPGETAEALMERAVRALQTRTPFARQA